MDQAHLDKGAEHPALGPHYFAARDAVEKFMTKFEAEHFEPIVKKAANDLYGMLLDTVQSHLMFDAESNLQGLVVKQGHADQRHAEQDEIDRDAKRKYGLRGGCVGFRRCAEQDGRGNGCARGRTPKPGE